MKKLLASLAVSSLLLGACAKEPAPDPVNPRDAVLNSMTAVYEAGTLHEDFKMSVSGAGEISPSRARRTSTTNTSGST